MFFFSVADHDGYDLVKRTIQIIKRTLGAIQLKEICPKIQYSLKSIIYDIHTTTNSVNHFSPFELQNGRTPNS